MLRYLIVKNFRAFKNERFDFGRINIFVGKNNSGKSSALSALNFIAQSVRPNGSRGDVVLNGEFDELGTFVDVVHGHNPRTRIGFVLGINEYEYDIELKYRSQRREIEICKYYISRNEEQIVAYTSNKDSFDLKYKGRSVEAFLPGSAKRRPEFDGLLFRDNNLRAWRFLSEAENKFSPDQIREMRAIEVQLDRARQALMSHFDNYDSLSPFREPPRRTFHFSGTSSRRIGRHGTNAIDMLVADTAKRGKASYGFIDSVSQWILSASIGHGINVRTLTSRHFEVVVTGKDGIEHNLCDVGFGISQALPVLVGAINLWKSDSGQNIRRAPPAFVVQEPEIHLHPDAQAELASFFVGLAAERGQLFLETHSPDLIIRMQYHVARNEIDHETVKVFFVEAASIKNDKACPAVVTKLELKRDGFFEQKWPGGFFPQREGESFRFARAAAASSDGTATFNDIFE